MEQILISAYTLDNLLNARREFAVGNVAGFTGRIDNVLLASLKVLQKMSY